MRNVRYNVWGKRRMSTLIINIDAKAFMEVENQLFVPVAQPIWRDIGAPLEDYIWGYIFENFEGVHDHEPKLASLLYNHHS